MTCRIDTGKGAARTLPLHYVQPFQRTVDHVLTQKHSQIAYMYLMGSYLCLASSQPCSDQSK